MGLFTQDWQLYPGWVTIRDKKRVCSYLQIYPSQKIYPGSARLDRFIFHVWSWSRSCPGPCHIPGPGLVLFWSWFQSWLRSCPGPYPGPCPGPVLVLSWSYPGPVLVLSWFCPGPVLVLSWSCPGPVLVLSWSRSFPVLVLVLVSVLSWSRS